MYGQSLPVGTYTLASLTACEVIKQTAKLLANQFTEFFFEYLRRDKPRHIEPRTARTGLLLVVLVAIDGVEERQVTAVVPTIAVAYAKIDIDAVGQVEERHGSASVFDIEPAFLHGRAQCARIADAHHIKAVALDFYHLFVPFFGIGTDKVLLLLIIRSTRLRHTANQSARR